MALYSPAYISCSPFPSPIIGYNSIQKDNKNSFIINFNETIKNSVNNVNNSNYKSFIISRQYNFFESTYNINIDYLRLLVSGSLFMKRNSINCTYPLNPRSMINHFESFFIICISDQQLTDLSITSNTLVLGALYNANRSELNPFLNQVIYSSFPTTNNITNAISLYRNILIDLNIELPLNFTHIQYNKGFYLYLILGVGQISYGVDMSFGGNGLLDHEFVIHEHAGIPAAEAYSGSSNYGSYYVVAAAPTGADSAKIRNWYYTFNFEMYGKILP